MEQCVYDRKLTFCPSTEDLSVDELIKECPECNQFVLLCCPCNQRQFRLPPSRRPSKPCHHFRIVFTDGACIDNGRPQAKAGAGVAVGSIDAAQLSIPITDSEDIFPVRSNQRAELYAAIAGLKYLADLDRSNTKEPSRQLKEDPEAWIIASDSEYVVKGMTEWLPTWRRKNWRTSKGTEPANLDLFLALDQEVTKHEVSNVKVGFWYIPREYNQLADRLAKSAARMASKD